MRPSPSTNARRSGSQSPSSSDGSPSVRASASLTEPGGECSSSTTRSATAERELLLHSTPAASATGIASTASVSDQNTLELVQKFVDEPVRSRPNTIVPYAARTSAASPNGSSTRRGPGAARTSFAATRAAKMAITAIVIPSWSRPAPVKSRQPMFVSGAVPHDKHWTLIPVTT